MHERPTDNGGRQTAKEVHSQSKAGDSEGMGFYRKRGGGVPALWDSSFNPVSLEEEIGAGGGGVSQGEPIQTEPSGKGTGKKNQTLKDTVILLSQDLMLLKKRMNLV